MNINTVYPVIYNLVHFDIFLLVLISNRFTPLKVAVLLFVGSEELCVCSHALINQAFQTLVVAQAVLFIVSAPPDGTR